MADFQNQKKRLKEFIKSINVTSAYFEKAMGLSNGYINSMRKGLGYDRLEQISSLYPTLNMGWLLTGEGEMFKQSSEIVSEDNLNINDMDMKTLFDVIRRQNARLDELEQENANLRRKYEPLEERVAV